MNANQIENISQEVLQHSLQDSGYALDFSEGTAFEQLREYIRWLMVHKIDFLLSLMYRLDIPESAIKNALYPGNPDEPDLALANLIIQRQLNRIETRKKYSSDAAPLLGEMEW